MGSLWQPSLSELINCSSTLNESNVWENKTWQSIKTNFTQSVRVCCMCFESLSATSAPNFSSMSLNLAEIYLSHSAAATIKVNSKRQKKTFLHLSTSTDKFLGVFNKYVHWIMRDFATKQMGKKETKTVSDFCRWALICFLNCSLLQNCIRIKLEIVCFTSTSIFSF